jgi:hypothetical protein
MLRDVIAIETILVGAFHKPQALLVEFGQCELVAIDPVEDAEFYRCTRWRVRHFILRADTILVDHRMPAKQQAPYKRMLVELADKLEQIHVSGQREGQWKSNVKVEKQKGSSRERGICKPLKNLSVECGQGRSRTADTRIFSPANQFSVQNRLMQIILAKL